MFLPKINLHPIKVNNARLQGIIDFLAWTNFKNKKRFVHKLQYAEIFVLFIFSAWLLSGSYLLYVLFIFLTYVFICQLDRPKFHIHLTYTEAVALHDLLPENELLITDKLDNYVEKYE